METVNYSGILKEKSEAEGGWKLSVDIPSISRQYPTILSRVPAEDAAKLRAGEAYAFTLEQGSLKKDKNGSQPWHYWWNYRGLGKASIPSGGTPPDRRSEQAVTQNTEQDFRERADARERSIERQVALKEARQAAEWFIAALDPDVRLQHTGESLSKSIGFFMDTVEALYSRFIDLLQSHPDPVPHPDAPSGIGTQRPADGQRKADMTQDTTKDAQGPKAAVTEAIAEPRRSGIPEMTTFGQLFTWAFEVHNMLKPRVLEILGVKDMAQIEPKYGSLKAAAEVLAGRDKK